MIYNFRHILCLSVLALPFSVHAQTSVNMPVTQVTPVTIGPAQEGCAGDAAQLCPNMSASGRSQCLQSNLASVSVACQAAMAQTPAAGIARHLGFDPPPTSPPAAVPVNLPSFTPPQAPAAQPAPTGVAPPPPARLPPTIILAPPPNATNTGTAPVSPTSSANPTP